MVLTYGIRNRIEAGSIGHTQFAELQKIVGAI